MGGSIGSIAIARMNAGYDENMYLTFANSKALTMKKQYTSSSVSSTTSVNNRGKHGPTCSSNSSSTCNGIYSIIVKLTHISKFDCVGIVSKLNNLQSQLQMDALTYCSVPMWRRTFGPSYFVDHNESLQCLAFYNDGVMTTHCCRNMK